MGWWAARICEFSTSRLSQVTVVTAVPANPRHHPYHLPDVLGEACATCLGIRWAPDLLVKTRRTDKVKLARTYEGAVASLTGAFESSQRLGAAHVLVVDDVVHTGATLVTASPALRDAGAGRVAEIGRAHV